MSSNQQVQSREDRSALIAVTVFPLIIIAAFIFAFFAPKQASFFGPWVTPLLGIIMFGMGLTLTPSDFVLVLRRPLPVLIGVVAQFLIMPSLAFVLSRVFIMAMPEAQQEVAHFIAVGIILVGCAPGGTSSNVISYLSKADVALSVTMTSISTLLAPIMTPLLTRWLAGAYMPIDGGAMAYSIVKVVLLPVLGGLVLRVIAGRFVEMILPALPWISTLGIAGVILAVVSGSVELIKSAGLVLILVVVLHNLCGYGLGYLFARLFKVSQRGARTTSIEVGMQNSGLAAQLATAHFANPAAALPGAIFSTWHNISGGLLAVYYRTTATRAERKQLNERTDA